MQVSDRNYFHKLQNILQRATHLLSDTDMGQGFFINLGGLHFNLDQALPAGKSNRANKYTRFSNCKSMRGTES